MMIYLMNENVFFFLFDLEYCENYFPYLFPRNFNEIFWKFDDPINFASSELFIMTIYCHFKKDYFQDFLISLSNSLFIDSNLINLPNLHSNC